MVTFWEVYQKAVKENGCNAGETFALSMFRAGAEWQLQQLGHPDPPGEQGADGTTIIKGVIKEKAIEAFNEAMIYFESPDCPTAEEALKHFIACLDQGLDSGCSVFPNNQICGDCDAYCECQMAGAEHNDVACPGFDDSVLSQHKERGKHGH